MRLELIAQMIVELKPTADRYSLLCIFLSQLKKYDPLIGIVRGEPSSSADQIQPVEITGLPILVANGPIDSKRVVPL